MRARRAARRDAPRPGVRDRVGVRGLRRRRPCSRRRHGRPDSRASSVGRTCSSTAPASSSGHFVDTPLELIERALAVNYLGCVWLTRGPARPGSRGGTTRRARAHRQHRVDRRRDRVHPGRALLRLEARPGGVLAVAASRVARHRHRGAHDPAGVRDDARLPTSEDLLDAARPARSSSAPSASRGSALGGRARQGRSRDSLVPLQARRRSRRPSLPTLTARVLKRFDYPDDG